MPALTSSNQVGKAPSSMPNSKLVSHWIPSWSAGMPARISSSSAIMRASYGGSTRAWSGSATKALIGASGVGRQTWKRQPAGTTPSRFRTANSL